MVKRERERGGGGGRRGRKIKNEVMILRTKEGRMGEGEECQNNVTLFM